MELKPIVIDNCKLHLLACLVRAYNYTLRYKISMECFEFSIWGNKKPGLPAELLAGGQGYTQEEAIENCFLDTQDQKQLLGTKSNQWIEFTSEEDLDLQLTLMGYNADYEPVFMRAIDFDKYEHGQGDGKPVVLAAMPEKGYVSKGIKQAADAASGSSESGSVVGRGVTSIDIFNLGGGSSQSLY